MTPISFLGVNRVWTFTQTREGEADSFTVMFGDFIEEICGMTDHRGIMEWNGLPTCLVGESASASVPP